jgi:hypothetical protein
MIRTGAFESVLGEFRPQDYFPHFNICALRYALSGLVKTLGIRGEQGWNQAESIFVRLYQLFELSKNPTRETLLVAVGSMGK